MQKDADLADLTDARDVNRPLDNRNIEQPVMQFGDWWVQPSLDRISHGPDQRKLERKAMQVLLLLLSRPGEVVSIQEILQHVWAGRVVEENSVHRRISQLRKALGDDAHHPTYIASVPRRGYRTVATVQRAPLPQRDQAVPVRAPAHHTAKPVDASATAATAMLLTPDTLATDAVLVNVLRQLRRWHHTVLLGTGLWPVVLLVVLGTVPLLVNAIRQGVAPAGVLQNGELLFYGLFLPVWFVCCRRVMRLSFGLSNDSPLAAERRFQPMRQLVQAYLQDGWPLVLALVFSSVLLGLQHRAGAVALPFAQLVLGYLIALSAIYILLFSYAYNQGIYLRARARRAHQYVLDFDDGDRRFGLRPLTRIFDAQIILWGLGGGALLIYRYMQVPQYVGEQLSAALVCQVSSRLGPCDPAFAAVDLSLLLPDLHTALLMLAWFGLIPVSAWLTNLKLLPLRTTPETGGRLAFLKALVPADHKYAVSLDGADLTRSEALVDKFRAHDFAPIGDNRALDTIRAYAFMWCLMCVPLLPATLPQALLLCVFAGFAFSVARLIYALPRHLLARVDQSLV